jgi:hypothetical protein
MGKARAEGMTLQEYLAARAKEQDRPTSDQLDQEAKHWRDVNEGQPKSKSPNIDQMLGATPTPAAPPAQPTYPANKGIPPQDYSGDEDIAKDFNMSPEAAKLVKEKLSVEDREDTDPEYNEQKKQHRAEQYEALTKHPDLTEEDKQSIRNYHETQRQYDDAY